MLLIERRIGVLESETIELHILQVNRHDLMHRQTSLPKSHSPASPTSLSGQDDRFNGSFLAFNPLPNGLLRNFQ